MKLRIQRFSLPTPKPRMKLRVAEQRTAKYLFSLPCFCSLRLTSIISLLCSLKGFITGFCKGVSNPYFCLSPCLSGENPKPFESVADCLGPVYHPVNDLLDCLYLVDHAHHLAAV